MASAPLSTTEGDGRDAQTMGGRFPSASFTADLSSDKSFRLLAKLTMTVLFQLQPKMTSANVLTLMPAMMDALWVVPPALPSDPGEVARGTPASNGRASHGRCVTTPLLLTPRAAPAASAPTQTPKTHKTSKGSSPSSSVMAPLLSLPSATPMPTPTSKLEHKVRRRHHCVKALLLLSVQVKALGFVAYLLRGGMAAEDLRPFEDGLAACFLQLLKNW